MSLSRRRFISMAGGTAGAAALSGVMLSSRGGGEAATVGVAVPTVLPTPTATGPATSAGAAAASTGSGDRVLVLVQMSGGNDGLNTLVPTSLGQYRDARPTLALPESDLIALPGAADYALHPSLGGLTSLWDDGRLAVLQAIGMPEQSRSHFVALDTWWSATPGIGGTGGWLGRWIDATAGADNPLRAVALGGGAPALVNQTSSPIIVQSVSGFDLVGTSDAAENAFAAMGVSTADGLLGRAQDSIPVAVDAVEELTAAFGNAGPGAQYGRDGADTLFEAAADLVEADLGTQVIVVNLGGFDTHANQLNMHAPLLQDMADGVAGFFERLTGSGHADRTLVMAYSEFGRRVAENGSGGTDHGSGGLAFLAGPGVAGGTVTGNLDLVNLVEGDVPIDVDSRSLYANALDWLGGPTSEVLGGEFDTYGLIGA